MGASRSIVRESDSNLDEINDMAHFKVTTVTKESGSLSMIPNEIEAPIRNLFLQGWTEANVIEYTEHSLVLKKFLENKESFRQKNKPSHEIITYHGTLDHNFSSILDRGMLIGGKGIPIANSNPAGGVYTALHPDHAKKYSSSSLLMILRCVAGNEGAHDGVDTIDSGSVKVFLSEAQILPAVAVRGKQFG